MKNFFTKYKRLIRLLKTVSSKERKELQNATKKSVRVTCLRSKS